MASTAVLTLSSSAEVLALPSGLALKTMPTSPSGPSYLEKSAVDSKEMIVREEYYLVSCLHTLWLYILAILPLLQVLHDNMTSLIMSGQMLEGNIVSILWEITLGILSVLQGEERQSIRDYESTTL